METLKQAPVACFKPLTLKQATGACFRVKGKALKMRTTLLVTS
jgi:hypothetical protein